MTTLSKHKSILCTQCGKSFTRQSHLEEHINIHEGKKPYECEICARPFASKSNLAKHERIHTGEKQFTCTKCKKRFTLKRNMIEHEKIHSGKRDHECKICNQTFTRNCSLTRHLKAQRHVRVLVRYLRIHTGKKHFECYECPKEFPFKNYLRQHIIVEHLKKKFWKPRHCYDPKKEHIDVSSSIPQVSKVPMCFLLRLINSCWKNYSNRYIIVMKFFLLTYSKFLTINIAYFGFKVWM